MSEQEVKDAGNLQKYYASIPHLISDDERLTRDDRALYLYYKRVAGDNSTCYQSNSNVSKRSGLGMTLLRECQKHLVDTGYIEAVERAGMPTLITVVDVWDDNFAAYAPHRVASTTPPRGDALPHRATEGGHRVASTTPPRGDALPHRVASTKNNPLSKTPEEETKEEAPRARKAPAFIKTLILSEADSLSLTTGFPERDVPAELAQFNDYQRAVGRGYSDHLAAFRNWLRRPKYDKRTTKASGPTGQLDAGELFALRLASR